MSDGRSDKRTNRRQVGEIEGRIRPGPRRIAATHLSATTLFTETTIGFRSSDRTLSCIAIRLITVSNLSIIRCYD